MRVNAYSKDVQPFRSSYSNPKRRIRRAKIFSSALVRNLQLTLRSASRDNRFKFNPEHLIVVFHNNLGFYKVIINTKRLSGYP